MDENQKLKLWEEYEQKQTSKVREKLIIEYSELVKIVAGRMSMYFGSNVEYEDLIGYGIIGLIDAIDKFDRKKGVKFETYASFRIKGAIIDEIRKLDWVPRSVRQKEKKIKEITLQIESNLGRNATREEIAKELNITINELEDLQSQIQLSNLISLDDYLEQGNLGEYLPVSSSHYETPEKNIEREELRQVLEESIETLTKREKEVIVLYYYEELTLKEISYILKVTESRISQLHTKALQKMKLKLGSYTGKIFASRI